MKYFELPKEIQKDFIVQFENIDYESEFELNDFLFELTFIKYEEILEILDCYFGSNLDDYIFDDYIIKLAQDISENGLQFPPIGNEGIHRLLAYAYLKSDIPYFKITNKCHY